MEDRLVTILTDLQMYCPNAKKVSINGLIFILQDLYYLDYNAWEEWRHSHGYQDWLIENLTK